MALVFNPNTYAGRAATGYLTRALLMAPSINNQVVTTIPNCKGKTVLRGLRQDVVFQDAACAFNASGNTTIDERYLNPVNMSVMHEICFKDLLNSWEADSLRAGANNTDVPTELSNYLIDQMRQKINLGVEKLIWQGKKGTEFAFTDDFDGLVTLAAADANTKKLSATLGQLAITGISIANPGVVTVASTANLQTGDRVTITDANAATLVNGAAISGQTFTITVLSGTTFHIGVATTGTATANAGFVRYVNQSNVVEVLTQVYLAVPDAVKSQADFQLLVPTHVADAYRLKQSSVATGSGPYFTQDKALNFLGKTLIELPALEANTLMATRASNLFFGTDLVSDHNEVQVVDMRQTTADQKVRYRANFNASVNFGYADEVVLYRPLFS